MALALVEECPPQRHPVLVSQRVGIDIGQEREQAVALARGQGVQMRHQLGPAAGIRARVLARPPSQLHVGLAATS